ncbi:solute carrier family 13 member 2 [Silurus meridionalis]|nr:solute carrier family 13 member 2 [Silurus meridionalis]
MNKMNFFTTLTRELSKVGRWLLKYRNYLIIYITPLLLLPLPLLIPSSEAYCGYVILLMAIYWCTECIPLAITALLPVILFPFLRIMNSEQVCVLYLKDTNMLFIGGLVVAIAVEHWNLHKRIALSVLLLVGVRPALLMFGFMSVTAFLSMWISNTATTAMMLPIAQAVLEQLSKTEAERDERELREGQDNQAFEMVENTMTKIPLENQIGISSPEHVPDLAAEHRREAREKRYLSLNKGMSLSVCYSASIGGTATLTGTTPNLILKGQMDSIYKDNPNVINFASWFGFAFPNMMLMLALSWLWLQFMYLGFNFKKTFGCGTKNDSDREAYIVMKQEYKKLGRMKFAEGAVLAIFVLLVVLWFSREPGFMPGWASSLNQAGQYVTDGTVAISIATLFFLIPSKLPFKSFGLGRKDDEQAGTGEGENQLLPKKKLKTLPALLNWKVVHERMPWNVVLLLGGGYALAEGSKVSKLSDWLGTTLAPLQSIPPFAISLLLCLVVGMFTECSSNTATTTLFLPILATMAETIKLHPLYVMLPCTISASLAFMLPVATPPNAIAFSYGTLKVVDMAKAGFVLNIIGILCINLAINTWGTAMFDLNTFPSWINVTKTP